MGEPRKLWLPGPAGRLEAGLRVACPVRAAAVFAHPHPLHGGTLHHPVVFHAERELHRANLTTLRFNFRGVGQSEGEHDSGRGEVGDLAAAASWLRGVALGVPLLVVGYSFGAWCALRQALEDHSIAALVVIGLPVTTLSLDRVGELGRPLAVVQGQRDEFGTPEQVAGALRAARPPARLQVVPEATHLFPGRAREAGRAVLEATEAILDELQVRRTG